MDQRDLVIVGAGIVGLCIAHKLAHADPTRRIAVFDPLGVGQEATAVAPGGVRQQWSTPVNCRMGRYGHAFYAGADRLLEEPRTRMARGGYLFVAHDDGGWNALRAAAAIQHAEGIATEVLAPQTLLDRFGFLAPDETLRGATFLQDDGYLDNPRAVVVALERQTRAAGVEFRFEPALAVESEGGRVAGVVTPSGRSGASGVVLAAGAATPAPLEPLGIACPIEREPRHLLFSPPVRERVLEPLVIAPRDGVAAKQLASGHIMASALEGSDPEDVYLWRRKIRAFARRALPQLAMVELSSLSSGYYDSTPDHQGIVSPSGIEGLWIAAGMSGHGFMMAPAVAETIGHLMAGTPCPWPTAPLALGRFSGRDPLVPEGHVV